LADIFSSLLFLLASSYPKEYTKAAESQNPNDRGRIGEKREERKRNTHPF